MADPLRVGVIGCGAIAQIMHIPHLVEYDEYFKLLALSDVDRGTLDAVAIPIIVNFSHARTWMR
jgi:predicted dehydrogenase